MSDLDRLIRERLSGRWDSDEVIDRFTALGSVVDLHVDSWGFCRECTRIKGLGSPINYPCPTILGVAEALRLIQVARDV